MRLPIEFRHPLLKTFLYSIWVPISVVVLYLIRFGMMSLDTNLSMPDLYEDASSYLMLLISWPFGMSITLAFQKLFRQAPKTAIFTIVVFAPLCALAVTVGGLLGPVGVAAFTIFISLPVWLQFFVIRIIHNRRQFRSNL